MLTTRSSSTCGRHGLLALAVLGALLTLALESVSVACAEDLAIEPLPQHYNAGVVNHGCHACRTGNCSRAVENTHPGVYCGDLVITFQPCCCAFRNECMTTIFSEACECYNSDDEDELLTTRFYLFVVLTFVAWVLLIYDKMCGGPYKVANSSSHVLLANSPSAAQSLADSDSDDDDNDDDNDDASPQQQVNSVRDNDDDNDTGHDSVQIELTVLLSPRASGTSAHVDARASVAVESSLSPSSPSSPSDAARASELQPTALPASTSASLQSV